MAQYHSQNRLQAKPDDDDDALLKTKTKEKRK